ncbi:hypothetical protein C8R43DRAFT_1136178 [Mycena crocata]|nr:hypothetical protein C8R43DRAFT_1136178 [Mycena crocata]
MSHHILPLRMSAAQHRFTDTIFRVKYSYISYTISPTRNDLEDPAQYPPRSHITPLFRTQESPGWM